MRFTRDRLRKDFDPGKLFIVTGINGPRPAIDCDGAELHYGNEWEVFIPGDKMVKFYYDGI